MAKDLNVIYAYKIRRAAKLTSAHNAILKANRIRTKEDWKKPVYQPIKELIKSKYYLQQNRRCAYCRKRLNIDAYFNHIDHIIPKSHHLRWIFTPRNLVITCEVCNPLKNNDDTLAPGHSKRLFPTGKTGFTIFNPHFDKWENCFEIEDGMFIIGKNARGQETIRVCKLSQYHFSVRFAEESGVSIKSAVKRATIRMRNYPKTSLEYKSAQKVVDYYAQLI